MSNYIETQIAAELAAYKTILSFLDEDKNIGGIRCTETMIKAFRRGLLVVLNPALVSQAFKDVGMDEENYK